MVGNPRKRLEQLQDRIKQSDDLTDTDRRTLLTFSDRMALLRSEYGEHRHVKLLTHCTIMAEQNPDLTSALHDQDVAEDLVRWINRNYDNEDTNRDYRIALRVLGKRVAEENQEIETDDNGTPRSLTWIPTNTSRNYDPKPDPANMLDWQRDVRPMIDATMNARDAALIAVAWDAGPRSFELLEISVGDVSDHKHGLQITVDGKRGQRSIMLITAVPYLNRWLHDHPRKDEPTAPLWCKLSNGHEISYQMANKIMKQAADRAEITKPVTFTNFRKSSASYLASQGVNQAVLENHHGWTRGSKAASRYISVFAEASDREIAKAHGRDVTEEEPDPIAALTCTRCGEKTPRDEEFCMWCHQALDHSAVSEFERKQKDERRQLLGVAKQHPELLDRLDELEPFIEIFGGDTRVLDTARQFVEETNS